MPDHKTTRCRECFREYNRRNIPPISKVLEIFEETGFNFVKTGAYFQVSSNAVKKWLTSAGLPKRSEELKTYILNKKYQLKC